MLATHPLEGERAILRRCSLLGIERNGIGIFGGGRKRRPWIFYDVFHMLLLFLSLLLQRYCFLVLLLFIPFLSPFFLLSLLFVLLTRVV